MNTHDGYEAGSDGAKCSKCGEWIGPGESCALMLPAEVDDDGSVDATALAIHGVVHMGCFDDL